MMTRFLFVVVALCMMLIPSMAQAQMATRDCCDIAAELSSLNYEYDVIDDRLTELEGNLQLGIEMQVLILLRVPFTAADEHAWTDISQVIQNIDTERMFLEGQLTELSVRIINLNQELANCSPSGGPLVPMPDPLP
jgi:hypothetical protein